MRRTVAARSDISGGMGYLLSHAAALLVGAPNRSLGPWNHAQSSRRAYSADRAR
jgi:hypothetical protein